MVLQDERMLFLMSYILLGSTDLLDGIIARNYNQKSEIGKTLDSVADLVFYLGSLYFIFILFDQVIYSNTMFLLVFFIFFSMSFIVSTVRFGKPILMHTQLLRLNAVLVYLLVIFSFVFDTTYMGTMILFIYYVAFTEEIVIFLKYDEFDRDAKSIFHLIRDGRGIE
jgi:CDP-diacylglycerol--glycerol-3-phosphate 3-phosphatidyltransferase